MSGRLTAHDIELCPGDIPEWLPDALPALVRRNVIIYKKGNLRALCHVCGEEIRTTANNKFYQYRQHACPSCGAESYCYIGGGRPSVIRTQGYFAFAQKGTDGETVFVRQFELMRPKNADYSDPIKNINEVATYVFRGKGAKTWHGDYPRKEFGELHYNSTFLTQGAAEAFAGTPLEYCGWRQYTEQKGERIIDFLHQSLLYPAIEHLHKRGYAQVVARKVRGGYTKELNKVINLRAKTKKELFRLPVEIINARAAGDVTLDYLLDGLALHNAGKTPGECIKLLRLGVTRQLADRVRQYTTDFERVARYLHRQGENVTERDWTDYMWHCKELGYDVGSREVMYPRDFAAAHRDISQEYVLHCDEIEAVKMAEKERQYAECAAYLAPFEFSADGLSIRPCASRLEMKAEGDSLHHCVGTYFERAAIGETNIMFVRREAEPDKPFYTLEMKIKGTKISIEQCRGVHNAGMTSEVERFVEAWEKHAAKIIKKTKEMERKNNERGKAGVRNHAHVA